MDFVNNTMNKHDFGSLDNCPMRAMNNISVK